MIKLIKALSFIGIYLIRIYQKLVNPIKSFPGSKEYWEKRYQSGGHSGAGSYNNLAMFKAEVLNDFVKNNRIDTVIEYGCGDGNQLKFANYPSYIGFDVSQSAIARCRKSFECDTTKTFRLLREYNEEIAQLTLSLDVIYHLIEEEVFSDYMKILFSSSTQFVIIYSSNSNGEQYKKASHVKHRKFTDWIETNLENWELFRCIPNKYPFIKNDENNRSFADFYIYRKTDHDLGQAEF